MDETIKNILKLENQIILDLSFFNNYSQPPTDFVLEDFISKIEIIEDEIIENEYSVYLTKDYFYLVGKIKSILIRIDFIIRTSSNNWYERIQNNWLALIKDISDFLNKKVNESLKHQQDLLSLIQIKAI